MRRKIRSVASVHLRMHETASEAGMAGFNASAHR